MKKEIEAIHERAPKADARPFAARLETLRSEPQQLADVTVTLVALRLTLRWPGGAWVYGCPAAIDYDDGRHSRRQWILPIQRIALAGIMALGLGMSGVALAQRRSQPSA